ncbi:MAG: ATP-binding protein [Acetobacteraceae bacterium]
MSDAPRDPSQVPMNNPAERAGASAKPDAAGPAAPKRRSGWDGWFGNEALLILTILVLTWGGLALEYRQEHNAAVEATLKDVEGEAHVFEEVLNRTISSADQLLRVTRDIYLKDPNSLNLGVWAGVQPFLSDLSIQLSIANADGLMVQSNLGVPKQPVSIRDREHFRVHADGGPDRLFISRPVVGRVSGRTSVQFTRRIVDPSGAFAGVVVASIDPFVLGRLFDTAEHSTGFVALFGLDGVIRAGRPAETLVGRGEFPDPDLLARAREQARGHYLSKAGGPSGTMIEFRRLGTYPLVLAVGAEMTVSLATFAHTRAEYVLVGTIITVVVLLVGGLLIRHRQKGARYQHALAVTLENISQGILMVDANRRIPVINRRAVELLGLPRHLTVENADFDAVLRWQIERGEFSSGADEETRIAVLASRGGLDAASPMYERTRANGTVLEVRTTILPDGSAVRTFTDITDRRMAERDLAAARDAAEAAGRARAEFLTVMSHEIRTPLNGIIGTAGLLLDGTLRPEEAEYVRIIKESGDHLLLLIDDILDFSRLDAGRVELELAAFDLADMVRGTLQILQSQAGASGLDLACTLDPDLPRMIVGDRGRLRQILLNLISNGIKFTEKGYVHVAVRRDAADRGRLAFTVTDTGIGIAPEVQTRLFQEFRQGDSSISRRFGGSGLGLAICRRLVGLMGGSIAVESTLGQGSRFRFDIPLCEAEAERDRAEERVAAPSGPKRVLRVLIAEDNPTNRLVATRMVGRMGHHVDAVTNGAEAVEAMRDARYDVVLMDMMMPGMDGLAATRAIRAGGGPASRTPIVGLTANAAPQDERACRDAGMDGFVTKPVSAERLAAAIDAALSGDAGPAPAAAPAPETLIDEAFLADLAANIGMDGAVEALGLFLEDGPKRGMLIAQALADGAPATLRREAHALAGAARAVGLVRLGQGSSALQKAVEASEPDPGSVRDLLDLLEQSVRQAETWVATHRDQAPGAPEELESVQNR